MSVMARLLMGALGAAVVAYAVMAWRSQRMPFMVGKEDARYWGRRWRTKRVWDTLLLGVMGLLMLGAAILG